MPSITTMPTPATPVTPDNIKQAVAKPKPAAKKAARQTEEVEQQVDVSRPVIYPEVRAEICHGSNAVTEKDAELILDWVTEAQFQARMMQRQPGTEAGAWVFGDVYMLRDATSVTDKGVPNGAKVRCLNNLDNRPFDDRWCLGLTQTILRHQWAGPITIGELITMTYGKKGMQPWTGPDGKVYQIGDLVEMSAGTINGSSISLSRTGRVESGQHTLCALKRACEMYRAAPKGAYPEWDAYLAKHADRHDFGHRGPAPVIETILVTGLSEDRRVLMTVDNCKPRSEADVFYTSDIFVKLRDQPSKRQEMSRMLAACCDLFWKRTARQGYKTHSEVMQMVLDHPKLIKAVEHLFTENADVRRTAEDKLVGGYLISNLGLSAGQSAALCYIMGCSASDGDVYRNGKPSPREKGLDWSNWDKAKEFWALIGGNPGFEPLRRALKVKSIPAPDSDAGSLELTGGLDHRAKMCLLANAWRVWLKEGRQFTELDLTEGGCLFLRFSAEQTKTVSLDDGGTKVVTTPAQLLEDPADFGGIDAPDAQGPEEPPKTAEQLEKDKENIRIQKAREAAEQIRRMRLGQDGQPVAPKPVIKPQLKGGVG